MKSLSLSLAMALAITAGTASAATPEDTVRNTLVSINPNAEIHSIKPAAPDGWQEVVAAGSVVYVSNDGRFIMYGQLFDTVERVNLASIAMNDLRKTMIAKLPTEGRLVYKPEGEVKHRVVVFTDTTCGYCAKLHSEIDGFLAKGIQVEYLAYPRGGPANNPAASEMDKLFCAKDPEAAYTAWMAGDRAVPAQRDGCVSPVATHHAAGESMGLEGTPAVYTLDGEQVGGYVQPDRLAAALDAKAREKSAGVAGGK